MQRKRFGVLTACGLAAVFCGWARHPGDAFQPGWNLFSRYHDVQVGMAAAQQARERYSVVQDAFLQNYIQRIGARLAAAPEARQSGFTFSFTMLRVPQVNAFALPGGPMFIFTGLFGATQNEAQLAGAMAHEMSHVILRHSTHEASKAAGVSTVTRVLGAAAAARGPATAQFAQLGLGFTGNSFILHFSREAEEEADLLGSHLMAEAGYNPIEMAHFFGDLAASGNEGSQFFSDHPNFENREHAIETEIGGLPPREYGYESGDFARAKIEALTVQSGGVVATRPLPGAPATAWNQFRGPRFTLSYPSNWNVRTNDSSTAWTIAPPEGLMPASGGPPQPAYGAIAGYFSPTVGRDNIRLAALELVAYLAQTRPRLQLMGTEPKPVRIDGAEAALTSLGGPSPRGGAEADLLLAVSRPGGGIFYLLCVAPQPQFPQLQAAFQQMIRSIRFDR